MFWVHVIVGYFVISNVLNNVMLSVALTVAWDHLCGHERSVSITDVIRNSSAMQLLTNSKNRTRWQIEPAVIFIQQFSAVAEISIYLLKGLQFDLI